MVAGDNSFATDTNSVNIILIFGRRIHFGRVHHLTSEIRRDHVALALKPNWSMAMKWSEIQIPNTTTYNLQWVVNDFKWPHDVIVLGYRLMRTVLYTSARIKNQIKNNKFKILKFIFWIIQVVCWFPQVKNVSNVWTNLYFSVFNIRGHIPCTKWLSSIDFEWISVWRAWCQCRPISIAILAMHSEYSWPKHGQNETMPGSNKNQNYRRIRNDQRHECQTHPWTYWKSMNFRIFHWINSINAIIQFEK